VATVEGAPHATAAKCGDAEDATTAWTILVLEGSITITAQDEGGQRALLLTYDALHRNRPAEPLWLRKPNGSLTPLSN
jgi:hypothetical protein